MRETVPIVKNKIRTDMSAVIPTLNAAALRALWPR